MSQGVPRDKRDVEFGNKVGKWSQAVDSSVITQGRNILSCIRIRGRQAIWDRVKPEGWQAKIVDLDQ